ncbi:MAG: hypothetical protein KAH21_04255 [Spirochaetaceae bacterium]|nr:hypothetical protein [Spirochaetaceae bacterium]
MSAGSVIDIPFILGGKEFFPGESPEGEIISLEYGGGETVVRFPAPGSFDPAVLFEAQDDLAKLSTADIMDFMAEVGKLWANPGYHRYQEALSIMKTITDFSEEELVWIFPTYLP